LLPSYVPDFKQQALKPASGSARAQVVAAELFNQLDIAMDDATSTLDLGF
jgi:hypothetical protein